MTRSKKKVTEATVTAKHTTTEANSNTEILALESNTDSANEEAEDEERTKEPSYGDPDYEPDSENLEEPPSKTKKQKAAAKPNAKQKEVAVEPESDYSYH